jgi:very-short-patch-repair endonuclease
MTQRQLGFDLLANQVGDLVASEVSKLAASDSLQIGTTPIEKLFGHALLAYMEYDNESFMEVIFCKEGEFASEQADDRSQDHLWAEQQVLIGNWRVDFVLHAYVYRPDLKNPTWRHLIVECDGHDFHERTKEQAARDRSRDRVCVLNGIRVFRFTGSEIWNDPLGCARQAYECLMFGT